MPVRELTTDGDFKQAFPVLRQLRSHLDETTYLETVNEMRTKGYRLFALEEDEEIVALAGISEGLNFYYDKYIWVYDLVTSEKTRSQGHGKKLLTYIEDLARDSGCRVVALGSALFRKDAHRFYVDKMGYERVSYTFVKELKT